MPHDIHSLPSLLVPQAPSPTLNSTRRYSAPSRVDAARQEGENVLVGAPLTPSISIVDTSALFPEVPSLVLPGLPRSASPVSFRDSASTSSSDEGVRLGASVGAEGPPEASMLARTSSELSLVVPRARSGSVESFSDIGDWNEVVQLDLGSRSGSISGGLSPLTSRPASRSGSLSSLSPVSRFETEALPPILPTSFGLMRPSLNDSYERKYAWIVAKMESQQKAGPQELTEFTVDRQTFALPAALTGAGAKSAWVAEFKVEYQGEKGDDYGGLRSNWASEMSQRYLGTAKQLFASVKTADENADDDSLMFLDASFAGGVNAEQASELTVAGRLLGKSVQMRQTVATQFAPVLLKALAGQELTLQDIDPTLHADYAQLLASDDDTIAMYCLTFSVRDEFKNVVDLVEGGRDCDVENREHAQEFVKLASDFKIQAWQKRWGAAVEALREGFEDIGSGNLLGVFTPQELSQLFSGSATLDCDAWRKATKVMWIDSNHDTQEEAATDPSMPPIVGWFWDIVCNDKDFSTDDKKRLLWMVTNMSSPPCSDFKNLPKGRFLMFIRAATDGLISTRTCHGGRLDIPNYPDQVTLRKQLVSFIKDTDNSFGFS